MPLPSHSSRRSLVRRFEASVTYRDREGKPQEEDFPVFAPGPQEANRLALAYVLQFLRLDNFELRVVGA